MRVLGLIITNKCNLNCGYCLRAKDNLDFPLEQLQPILDKVKLWYFKTIQVTGGEPYLHNNFYEIIKLIVDNGFEFTICSNGFNWEQYKPLIENYKEKFSAIQLSLEGSEPIHNKLRGKGSYKKVIEAIKYFSDKTETNVNMTLTTENYLDIESVLLVCDKLGVKNLNVTPASCLNSRNLPYLLNDNQLKEVSKLIETLGKYKDKLKVKFKVGIKINNFTFCEGIREDNEDIEINPLGQVIFCCGEDRNGIPFADINKESIESIMFRWRRLASKIKEARRILYLQGVFTTARNPCEFCNKCIKENHEKELRNKN